MKKTKSIKFLICTLFCTIIIISQTGCSIKEKEPTSETQYDLLNTTCTITIYEMNKKSAQTIISDAFSLCKEYENMLSKTIKTSDVYKINHSNGQPVSVSSQTLQVIEKGIAYGKLSDGRFDITVGKLSSLWDFSNEKPRVPNPEKIMQAIETVDYKNVKVEPNSIDNTSAAKVYLENINAELDLGGIAKGFIADRLTDFLKEKGVEKAIINLGGNIVAIGEKEESKGWNIGIEKPFSDRREVIGSVEVINKTIVTSGIYERKFEENGVLYHHILDVKTGYPTNSDVEAVTLVGDLNKSMDCDALSTICLMLGSEKGLSLIESIGGIEASFLTKDGEMKSTSGMEFTPIAAP